MYGCCPLPPLFQFIAVGCEHEVNLDARTRTALVQRVRTSVSIDVSGSASTLPDSVFDPLEAAAEKDMTADLLRRYLKTADGAEKLQTILQSNAALQLHAQGKPDAGPWGGLVCAINAEYLCTCPTLPL